MILKVGDRVWFDYGRGVGNCGFGVITCTYGNRADTIIYCIYRDEDVREVDDWIIESWKPEETIVLEEAWNSKLYKALA